MYIVHVISITIKRKNDIQYELYRLFYLPAVTVFMKYSDVMDSKMLGKIYLKDEGFL